MSRCLGTVSKALLMSIVARSVLLAALLAFRPSSVVCVRWVSSVDVEWRDLKPRCVLERGMCVFMLLRTNLSSIFEGVQSKLIGLYEVSSVGFRIGMILAISRCWEYYCSEVSS